MIMSSWENIGFKNEDEYVAKMEDLRRQESEYIDKGQLPPLYLGKQMDHLFFLAVDEGLVQVFNLDNPILKMIKRGG